MSRDDSHGLHEDNRNEAALVRKLAAHEDGVRRLLHDRWWRRTQPLMPTETTVYDDDDFDGCTL